MAHNCEHCNRPLPPRPPHEATTVVKLTCPCGFSEELWPRPYEADHDTLVYIDVAPAGPPSIDEQFARMLAALQAQLDEIRAMLAEGVTP